MSKKRLNRFQVYLNGGNYIEGQTIVIIPLILCHFLAFHFDLFYIILPFLVRVHIQLLFRPFL